MPKYYIESGKWRCIILSYDFMNAAIRALQEHIKSKDCGSHNLGDVILVNQVGFIGALYDEDKELRIKKHIFLKNLTISKALTLLKKEDEDIIIFLPTKKVLEFIGLCEAKCVEDLTHTDCQGLRIME
ncbi:hypothetical protein LCGC14_0608550 [marine sediment metagenome]|uniref:Uncharacterized protein n=1 Tax=marine sediment metagenome TaxID=412755 RepID=A0A0F9RSK3_9ZZZZ